MNNGTAEQVGDDQPVNRRRPGTSSRCGSRLVIPAPSLRQKRRVARARIILRGDCGQTCAKSFERIVPQLVSRESIQGEDFAITPGENRVRFGSRR